MASQNYIWAVDNCGHVHTLSTSSQLWHRLSSASDGHLVEFKKVTASQNCAWALGCNQELYVYVHPSDVPIRCLEYTYENQVLYAYFFVQPSLKIPKNWDKKNNCKM